MSKRFIIAAQSPSAESRNDVTKFLGSKGAYWHWLPDFWIFGPNNQSEYTANSLAEALRKHIGKNTSFLVLVAEPAGAWQAYSSPSENWGEWLDEYWSK